MIPNLKALRCFDLVYVGSVYSKYPNGIEAAFEDAARYTAKLMQAGIKVYSPIAHTHPLAVHGKIDPMDHNIWLPFDKAIMDKSDAMIVLRMDGWTQSFGIAFEIETFERAGKPVFHVEPGDLQ